MKGLNKNITLPEETWIIIDNLIDNKLISSRGQVIYRFLIQHDEFKTQHKEPIPQPQPNHIPILLPNAKLNQIDNKVEQTIAKTQLNGYDTTLTPEENAYLKRNYGNPI
jgi:hypothetical protein